jgi:hypothetical protein
MTNPLPPLPRDERKIDALLYELCGMTADEIKLVEDYA